MKKSKISSVDSRSAFTLKNVCDIRRKNIFSLIFFCLCFGILGIIQPQKILASDVQTTGQSPVTIFNLVPGTSLSNAVNFTDAGCSYSFNPGTQSFNAAGGNGNTSLITQNGCAYTVVSNAPFITVTSGGSGTGNGTISFTVAANDGPARTGTITIAGQPFTVTQADGCTYSLSPSSASFTSDGGVGSFAVTTGAGCTFTAESNDAFIIVNTGTVIGSGTVSFNVFGNGGAERTGTISVNNQIFTILQTEAGTGAGNCPSTISLSPFTYTSAGGAGSINITAPAGCNYTLSSPDSFITITNGTGNGNGVVTFSVAPNQGFDRSGSIYVNSRYINVSQTGECQISFPSSSIGNYSAAGGTESFTVITRANCSFTATTDSSFITILNGSGTGATTVTFSMPPNTGNRRGSYIYLRGNAENRIVGNFYAYQSAALTIARTAFDFDGDRKSDISVFRPENGFWYLLNSQSGFSGTQFGISTDKIVPADYDGDTKTDVAIFRDGIWYLNRSSLGFTGVSFGAGTDIPVPADFDGDGKADLAVFRPSNGTWYVYNSGNNQTSGFAFGQSGDKPVVSDYDGDGKANYAVFRPSTGTWYVRASKSKTVKFGDSNDIPVPGDYDGDGLTDFAVYRPSNGTWYFQGTTSGFSGVQFGNSDDVPVPADYDGDLKADIAVFRDGAWYLQRSTAGFTGVSFGLPTDKPAPNAFVR
jgi:hypothetical protein